MIFDWLPQMPFTDFHRLNQDWIIQTVKTWADAIKEFFDHGAQDLVEEVTPGVVADWFENEAPDSPVFTGAVEDAAEDWFNESAATSPVFTRAVQNSTNYWFENDAPTSEVFSNAVGGAVADYIENNGVGFTLKVNYKTRSGYLSTSGGYAPAGAETQEVFTNKLPCFPGDTISYNFTWESTAAKWFVVVFWDENGSFISRSGTLYGGAGTTCEGTFTIPANAYYYTPTYRTYGNCIANFFYNGSVYDIRNRFDKGLSHEEINGEYDRIRLNDPQITFSEDVLLPGNAYVTDFIQVPKIYGTRFVIANTNSLFTYSFMPIFFDGEKNYISNITWTAAHSYKIEIPTECEYIRFGFYNTATIESILAYFSYTFQNAEFGFNAMAWAFGENVKSVNHRGYNAAPENTLPAYKLSKQVGFPYCETDVSYTSDGVAVLLHDETINRTARNADGTTISGDVAINSITYEQALTYDFGIYKGSLYAGTRIPTFEQFIKLCKNLGLHPYIELKNGLTEARAQGLVDTVERCGMSGRVTWLSSNVTWLTYVKNYDTTARLGYVVGNVTAAIITSTQGLKTTDNKVFIDCSGITSEMVAACIAADIPVEVWVVNTAAAIEALDPYISGVTSDNLIAAKVLYEANI